MLIGLGQPVVDCDMDYMERSSLHYNRLSTRNQDDIESPPIDPTTLRQLSKERAVHQVLAKRVVNNEPQYLIDWADNQILIIDLPDLLIPYRQLDAITDLKGTGPSTVATITWVVTWEKPTNLRCVEVAGKAYDVRLASGSRNAILDGYWTEIAR